MATDGNIEMNMFAIVVKKVHQVCVMDLRDGARIL